MMIRFVHLTRGLSLLATLVLPACSGGGGVGNSGDDNLSDFQSGFPGNKSVASINESDAASLCQTWANYVIESKRDLLCRNTGVQAANSVPSSDSYGCFLQGSCPDGLPPVPPPAEGFSCTAECQDANGPVCSYECSGFTQAELEANCAAAKAAACDPTDADMQKACTDSDVACEAQDPAAVFDMIVQDCMFAKPVPPACTASVRELEACIDEQFATMEESLSSFPSCSDVTIAGLNAWRMRPAPAFPACQTFNDKCPGWLGG